MAENDPHVPEDLGRGVGHERGGHERSGHERGGHETGDVNVWAVGKFAIALTVVIGISLGLLVGLFKYFQAREQARPTAVSVDPNRLFPEPRLERVPVLDLEAVRAEEDRVLHTYGWVDAPHGVVRIPIDVAIDVLAKKGLPSRPPGAAKP